MGKKAKKYCIFNPGIKKLEDRIKLVGLPFFYIVTAIFCINEISRPAILRSLIQSVVSITIIWKATRFIVFKFHDYNFQKHFTRKLLFGISISLLVTCVVITGIYYLNFFIFPLYREQLTNHKLVFYLKNYLVNGIIFTMFVHGMYELLFMFQKFNNLKIEQEQYKRSIIESRLENLKSQINPHFLFNTFNALSDLIEENPKKASQVILELSDIYRYILSIRDKNWVDLDTEYKFLKSFIQLLKIRYEDNISFQQKVQNKYNHWYIPPLALQMLLENAIKHNEISSEKPLKIEIFTHMNYVVVKNNHQPRKNTLNSNGIGLSNIKMRYNYLNNKEVIVNTANGYFEVKLPLIKIVEE